MRYYLPEAVFPTTNESLPAIVAGLQLNPEDCVAAIGGSGDQAFAILETVKYVKAFDTLPLQVEYMQERKAYLESRNWEGFLARTYTDMYEDLPWLEDEFRTREGYFAGKLDTISKKIDALEIAGEDIFSASLGKIFNKLYLSNADIDETSLERLSNCLSVGGLIYHSSECKVDLPQGLVRDENLTHLAKKLDPQWNPVVYRKVSSGS